MSYTGMNARTGQWLSGEDHLRQSVRDILLTPQGTRVMRRDYGSLLPLLLDQPQNAATRLKIMSAVYLALWRQEPRIALSHIEISEPAAGQWQLTLHGQRFDRPGPFLYTLTQERLYAGD